MANKLDQTYPETIKFGIIICSFLGIIFSVLVGFYSIQNIRRPNSKGLEKINTKLFQNEGLLRVLQEKNRFTKKV